VEKVMINLKALEAAITKVESLRDHELTFNVGETTITLRPLAPDEETEVQKYAQVAWENSNEDGDQAAVSEFMDRLRHASLGYSIVQIGDLDLRGQDYLESGEFTEEGQPVVILKEEAIRNLVSQQWTRTMLTQVFAKFAELLERMENRATRNVVFDPVDLDDEIQRMEVRLQELKKARAESLQDKKDVVTSQQKAVAEMGRRNYGRAKENKESSPVAKPAKQDSTPREKAGPEPTAPVRTKATPSKAPPPPREENLTVEKQTHQQNEPPEYHPLDPRNYKYTDSDDSFFDPGDPDSEDAIRREGQRQAMLYFQKQERERLQKEYEEKLREAGIDPHARPEPPKREAPVKAVRLDSPAPTPVSSLRSAANTSQHILDSQAGSMTAARASQATQANLNGIPVFRKEAEIIEPSRGDSSVKTDKRLQIDPSTAGSRNPRFRGPGQ
jgi:hypothetical protein